MGFSYPLANSGVKKLSAFVSPPVCTLVPSETLGPFPSLPSGDTMYWRSDIDDGQAGVALNFTIRINGDVNCGVMSGVRVDVWHCNAHGFYSHYATGGTNNGHSGSNTPSNNANLIYCRGTQLTDSNGEVNFTTIFPGWYPGRTCHIHFAVYTGGIANSSSGWILNRVSQFTFPITEKNVLYTSQVPYTLYGADPLHPDNDNVFSSPAGAWSTYQLGNLNGSGSGPYSSYYEAAVSGTGALPLTLLGFNGSAFHQDALLWWKTESEVNFSHFEIEYSEDGEDFEYAGKILSQVQNLENTREYTFIDKDRLLYGHAYYRLKIVDLDGTFFYSSIIGIKTNFDIQVHAYPVPATNYLMLSHPINEGKDKILVMDSMGKPIGLGTIELGANHSQIDISLCAPGLYYLIYDRQGMSQTIKFVKH